MEQSMAARMRNEAPWNATYNRRMPVNEYDGAITRKDVEGDDLMKELEETEQSQGRET
jgi:hypothetical protein